jgi:putative copper resistance protein D
MWHEFIHSLPNTLDLLALTTCIGALSCRLWVLQFTGKTIDTLDSEPLLTNIWRLLAVCIIVLVFSSAVLLLARTAEMSGLPFAAVLPAVPTVLFKTHYGQIWLVRVVAVAVLCIGWWRGRRRLDSRVIPSLLLCSGAAIAMTRSGSGHGADAGDLSLPELMDWLHLMAASIWGGGLLALSTAILPRVINLPGKRQMVIADIASRFSTLAGIALVALVVTAVYNAWIEVGSFQALWKTPYGQIVIIKILLLITLMALGSSNRYISVPLLRRWAGRTSAGQASLYRLVAAPYISRFHLDPTESHIAHWFTRKVWLEGIIILVVLICTGFLLHEVPARHFSHTGHRHEMNIENMESR